MIGMTRDLIAVRKLSALGAVLAGGMFLAGCQPKQPVIDLHDVKLSSVGTRKIDLVLEFKIFNANLWDAKLKRLDFAVSLAGKDFVTGELANPARTFKALEWDTLEVPATVHLENLSEITARAKEAGALDGNLHCQAVFQVVGIDLPTTVRKPVHLNRPRWPIWHFKAIRSPEEKAEEGIAFEAVCDVENPNSFDLPTSAVRGQLFLGASPLARIDVPYPGVIPARGKKEVVLRVAVKPPKLEKSSWRSWLTREPLRFEGNFELDPPVSLGGDVSLRRP